MVAYRCVATSVRGFVQQLAVAYFTHGYRFYVTGRVPEGKRPEDIDRKLVERYGVAITKWSRHRRRRNGHASVQYLRHERFFVLVATHGEHRFFRDEVASIRDARRVPLKYRGYAVSFRGGHAHVRIERSEYQRVKAYLLDIACHRRGELVAEAFGRLAFEPYAPVRRQLLNLLRAVNRVRRGAGYSTLPYSILKLRRMVVRPFEGDDSEIVATDAAATP